MGAIKEEKTKYYDCEKLWNTNAVYLIPYGMRSNGKSYSFRGKVLKEFRDKGDKFLYLRRYETDIKTTAVEQYFDLNQIKDIFENKYDCVMCKSNEIWLGHYDEDEGKNVRDVHVGYYCALNQAEHYKSWSRLEECKTIIFEEFITTGLYLNKNNPNSRTSNEPELLMHFISTVFRLNRGRVVLIGNNVSQICPYWDFLLGDKSSKVFEQPRGTIEIYHVHNGDNGTIDIAVENCNVLNYKNNMFVGNAEKQIVRGEWEVNTYPQRPKGKWLTVLPISLSYLQFNFNILIQQNNEGELIAFVYPSDKLYDWLYTDKFLTSRFVKPRIDGQYNHEKLLIDLWKHNKFCYQDNLTGTNFNTLLTQYQFI